MSLRKLKAWEDAGLLDAATAARIRDWEAGHARPLGLRAVIAVAVLAIGLGLVSVVAANWDAIPGLARLAVHFALIAGCAVALQRRDHDALLFVLGMLGLTFFGHLGQVYQTSSPLHVPLGLWLLLFAPLLLARGRGHLIALLLVVTLAGFGWSYGLSSLSFAERSPSGDPTLMAARVSLAFAMPVLVAGLAAVALGRSRRTDLWRSLDHLALAYATALVSAAAVACAFIEGPSNREGELAAAVTVALTLLAAAALVRMFARDSLGRLEARVFAGLSAVPVLAWLLSGHQTMAALLFMGLWAGLAAAALRAGWRATFQQAVALIALRLVVLSFELASDLLTSGAGLILAGLLVLAVAWCALRIANRFAPARPELPGDRRA
ncbi:MAG: DUF2157 domain-containing protein [bacterium]